MKKRLSLLFVPLLLAGCVAVPSATMEEFAQLKNGMTYPQVKAIIGEDGTLDSRDNRPNVTQATYTWRVSKNSYLIAIFFNGKLASRSVIESGSHG